MPRWPARIEVGRDGPLLRAVFDHGGFVSYRDLGGVEGADLDDLIERTVAHFRDDTDVDVLRVEVARPRPARRPR